MASFERHRPGWSRRAVLGGAAASAGLALIPFARRPQRLFLSPEVPASFGAALQQALAASIGAPIELVRVTSLLEVPALLDASGPNVYAFAGPALERELARNLDGRRLVRLSFGTHLERRRENEGRVRHAHLALASAFEQAGEWAAEHLGSRAVIRATGQESTSDLAFAFHHGFESRGGRVVQTTVSNSIEASPTPPAEVTLVLASGPAAPRIWRALRGTGGHLLTHPFALGAPDGTRVISTWSAGSALEALAARAVDPGSPLEARLFEVGALESIRLSPSAAGTAHLAIEAWALKSGSSITYTGC